MDNETLRKKKLFLLDMDGTLYLGDRLFSGTKLFLETLKSTGRRYLYLTNNSSKGLDRYVQKLRRLGIEANETEFFSSVQATSRYLSLHGKGKRIYVFGTHSFFEELRRDGHDVTDRLDDDIDVLLLGFDTELTFQKLEDACILLKRGVTYLATNPDLVCPTEYGYVPDCGSVAMMLQNATGRRPQVIGKPEPWMLALAMERAGCTEEETVVVGDRLYTDIASGAAAGVSTVLVLSGEATRDDVQKSGIKPDCIFTDVEEIARVLRGEEGAER